MNKTLQQWLAYAETLHPKTIALGLERVNTVADRLNVRSFNCPVITVAGTNGKGSCVAFLEAILQQAGYKTGAYTSPHLIRFQERIHLDGKEIAENLLVAAFAHVEAARNSLQLTYFELTTLAALTLFAEANLDVIILEVGLGGRLDAVNSVKSDIAIITTIAMDHMDWLGSNREMIGREKAGIFRPGQPAICGDLAPPQSLFTVAEQIGALLYCGQVDFKYSKNQHSWDWQTHTGSYLELPYPKLPLQNAATALMAIHCLQARLPVAITAIRQGLKNAYLPGRFQQFSQPVPIVCDVAHNPAAAELLALRLSNPAWPGKTLAVVSMLSDKDISATLAPLLPQVDEWYIAPLAVPRGADVEIIANHLQSLGVTEYHRAASVIVSFKAAMSACGPHDRLVVFGSFYTVGQVLEFLQASA